MKKHIIRQKRSRRSHITGLALAAVLAVFPGTKLVGETLNVGPGKPYSTFEALRDGRTVNNGDRIVLFSDDVSMLGSLSLHLQDSTESASIHADGTTNRSITYGGLSKPDSRIVEVDRGSFSFGEYLTFKGSKQTDYGGIGLIQATGTINVDGTRFVSNHAGLGGAVFANEGGRLNVRNAVFDGNDADHGGAVYNNGGATVLSVVTAQNNTAELGGVIYQTSGSVIISDSRFQNNEASDSGGAIAVLGGSVSIKNADFIDNSATVEGGAVYVAGQSTLSISADQGVESVWRNNTAGVFSNAIYFDLDENDSPQKLNISGDGTISMYDSVHAVKNVDNNSSLTITKQGAGKWHLGGYNAFYGLNDATMKTTVEIAEGDLELGKGAGFYFDGEASFVVRAGTTLSSFGYNDITVDNIGPGKAIVVESGSKIELNMTAMEAGDMNGPMLVFDGWSYDENKDRAERDMSFGTITVDVTAVNAFNGDGDYDLVLAAGVDFSGATLLINGVDPSGLEPSKNNRVGTRTIKADASHTINQTIKDKIVLTLAGIDQNRTVTWNGTADAVWGEENGNWQNAAGDPASLYFLNGDDVVFGVNTGLEQGITVDANGVRFGTMTVKDDYAFTGGALNGDKIIFAADATLTFNATQIPDTDPPEYAPRTLNLSMGIDAGVKGTLIAGKNEILTVTAKDGDSAVTGQNGSKLIVGAEENTGEIRFVGSKSDHAGGAFTGNVIQILGGTTVFGENSATENGGAISARDVDISGGSVRFENNMAALLGGAIYATGDVSLAALNGDIVFAGNTQGGVANAIYMTNPLSNSLQLTTSAGQTILFSDPVENVASSKSVKAFTIDMNGSGTVHFEGYRSNVRGVTNVNGGTMKLSKGAVYGAATNNAGFVLNTGATLRADSSGTGISAESIRFDQGSTIRLDMNGALPSTTLLNLDGTVYLPELGGVNLDLLVTSQNGTYQLLGSSSTSTDFRGNKFVETVNGISADENIANDRAGTRKFTYERNAVYVELQDYDSNRNVTWSGKTGNVWSENAANWVISGTNKKYFLNGDSVLFNETGLVQSIDVAPGGVLVAGMKVTSGHYTFSGGDILKVDDGEYRTLEKSGVGTLTLNQRNVFDLVDVKAGALAGGNANGKTILGDLLLRYDTILSPGSSGIGVFRVEGGVDFQSGSYIYLDLGRTLEKSDQLIVTGTPDPKDPTDKTGRINFASDKTGTVTIVVSGNAVAKGMSTTGDAVITADEGLFLNGTQLENVTTNAKNEKVTIQRGANKIEIKSDGSLDLVSAKVTDGSAMSINAVGAYESPEAGPSFTWNQYSVSESIRGASSGTFANQLMAKYALTDDDAKAAFLEQLLPTLNSAMPKVTQRAVTQYRQLLYERLRNLNHDRPGHYIPVAQRSSETVRGQRYCPDSAPILWFHNYGDFMHQKRRHVQGYDSYAYGLALGTETWLDQNTVVGVGVGASFASVNSDDRSQKADANTFLFTPYISHTTQDGYKIMASLGYAYNDYDIRRHPGGAEVKSKHDGNVFLMNAEVSKKLHGVWTDITPFFGLEMVYLHEEGYREKSMGSAVSTVAAKTTESYLQTMGARFGRTRTNFLGWLANPSVSLGWIHDYGDGYVRTVANYGGGVAFTMRGSSMNRDRFALGLNYDAVVNERISFFTGYNGEFASRYDVHTIQLGCTLEF